MFYRRLSNTSIFMFWIFNTFIHYILAHCVHGGKNVGLRYEKADVQVISSQVFSRCRRRNYTGAQFHRRFIPTALFQWEFCFIIVCSGILVLRSIIMKYASSFSRPSISNGNNANAKSRKSFRDNYMLLIASSLVNISNAKFKYKYLFFFSKQMWYVN